MQLSYIQDCGVTLTSRGFLGSAIRWAHLHSTCNPYLCTLGGFATTSAAPTVPQQRREKTAGAVFLHGRGGEKLSFWKVKHFKSHPALKYTSLA